MSTADQNKKIKRTAQKPPTRDTKLATDYFDDLLDGMEALCDAIETGKKLTVRKVSLAKPPKPMAPGQLISLRQKMGCSQPLFASLLNVSKRAVQSWEQGKNSPNGASLRLLQVVKHNPKYFITDVVQR